MIPEKVPERLKRTADLGINLLSRTGPRFYLSVLFAAVCFTASLGSFSGRMWPTGKSGGEIIDPAR
ncbi:hypothetical protein EBX31_11450 [bacterium]|nr:hypothetical protein [bacterium]